MHDVFRIIVTYFFRVVLKNNHINIKNDKKIIITHVKVISKTYLKI